MKKLFCLLLTFAMMLCLLTGCGESESVSTTVADPVPEDFKGLVLVAPAGSNVILETEFEDGEAVPPSQVYETETYDYYCYDSLMGAFRCKCSGKGNYTVTQNIFMSQQEAETRTEVQIFTGQSSGEGWEPDSLTVMTEEFIQVAMPSGESLWQSYLPALQSPHFTGEHSVHQITTQEQMTQFLQGLDDADDSMYLFNTGYSGAFHHDIPMAIFTRTDLSGAKTLEEAAAVMGQEKPTVLLRAQMHGNEPAGGEAALAMIYWLDSTLGESYLDKMNICVIPRQNPDGAQSFQRKTISGVDMNRDSLRLETAEAVSFTKTCLLLEPEVIIDGHEYKNNYDSMTMNATVLVGVGYTPDNTDAFREASLEISHRIFAAENEVAQNSTYYSGCVNSANPSVSRAYASLQGTMFFLLETRGINAGLTGYESRIVAHLAGTKAIFDYVAQDPQGLQDIIDRERQYIIDTGSVYSSENVVYLDLVSGEDITLQHDRVTYRQDTVETVTKSVIPKVYNTVQRQRVAPTAYVIPAGESFTEQVLALMDKHGITYTFIPEGSTVSLQQYDSTQGDHLTDEKKVTFEKGAYVFCRNQVRGKLLSILMEPDVDDVSENQSTLVQRGMIRGENGLYPIYRYIHDLNGDGFIDYQ